MAYAEYDREPVEEIILVRFLFPIADVEQTAIENDDVLAYGFHPGGDGGDRRFW